MSAFFVYILAGRRNGTLYMGVTNDPARRMTEHKSGTVAGFARQYGVTRLVHVDVFDALDTAREQEHRLKKWRREWKLALIERDNPEWRDLADDLLK